MDVLALIRHDHAQVKALFKEFEALSPSAVAARTKLAKKITEELAAHDEAEEASVYSALRERLQGSEEREDRIRVLQAFEEHAAAGELIHKLHSTDPKEDEFPARFAVLRESVEQHIKEEEGHVHRIARATLSPADLEDLGSRFQDAKKHALA